MKRAGAYLLGALLAGASPAALAKAPSRPAHHHAKLDDATLATAPEEESEHVVKPGETLGGIAARTHVPRILIIEANGLKPPFAVHAGQRLTLPRTRHHKVKPGETRFDIAMRYGLAWSAIAVASGLAPDATLTPGQALVIPTIIAPGIAPGHGAEAVPDKDTAATPDDSHTLAEHDTDETGARPTFRWPVAGKVVRGFVPHGRADYHNGLDIAAAKGTAVRAAAGGTVVFAGVEPQRFGNLVVIDNAKPWQTVYGFLDKITVSRGETVTAHERIGFVGHSGSAPRSELHFEIRRKGKPLDPQTLLPQPPAATGSDSPPPGREHGSGRGE